MDNWKKEIRVGIDYTIKKYIPTSRNYPYESSNCYGMGPIIRRMAYLPKFMPLAISTDHGPSQRDEPTKLGYDHRTEFIFFHSQRLVKKYLENKGSNASQIYSPFVFFRRNIHKIKNTIPSGTMAFPAHSTDLIDAVFDDETYIKDLKKLDEKFHPIKICLYYRDIELKRHIKYIENGFEVYCAGHIYDPKFPEKFYNILSLSKYTTSNTIGSYTFYSIEAGLPFFLFGRKPLYSNSLDPNCPKGNYDIYKISSQMQMGYILFSEVTTKITNEQHDFVIKELGLEADFLKITFRVWLSSIKYVMRKLKNFLLRILFRYIYRIKSKYFNYRYGSILKIFTHLTFDEKIALKWCSKKVINNKGKVFVEIGSYLGASSCFIASSLKNDARLYCIDTWGNHAMKYFEEDTDSSERETFVEFLNNTKKYKDRIITLRGWSYDMIHKLKEEVNHIDFLFIDGDHNYEGVKKDWELYSPLLRKNSIVAFHDVGWAEGVNRVIDEYVKKRSELIYSLPNLAFYRIID